MINSVSPSHYYNSNNKKLQIYTYSSNLHYLYDRNNKLSSLLFNTNSTNYPISPLFSPEIKTYSINVPNNTIIDCNYTVVSDKASIDYGNKYSYQLSTWICNKDNQIGGNIPKSSRGNFSMPVNGIGIATGLYKDTKNVLELSITAWDQTVNTYTIYITTS